MSRVLRLFALRRKGSAEQVEGIYFMDQGNADKRRDVLSAANGMPYVVCPGPDHKRFTTWQSNIEREAERERKEMTK